MTEKEIITQAEKQVEKICVEMDVLADILAQRLRLVPLSDLFSQDVSVGVSHLSKRALMKEKVLKQMKDMLWQYILDKDGTWEKRVKAEQEKMFSMIP